MIYTELTCKAMKIAYNAHNGQTDKNGIPYIFHPFHLAEQMTDEKSICAALLHDTVEDTDITIEDLEKEFPKEITDVLRLLTHDKNEDYFSYISKIRNNPTAKAVKLADLRHNSDISRYTDKSRLSDKKVLARLKKYEEAIRILNE